MPSVYKQIRNGANSNRRWKFPHKEIIWTWKKSLWSKQRKKKKTKLVAKMFFVNKAQIGHGLDKKLHLIIEYEFYTALARWSPCMKSKQTACQRLRGMSVPPRSVNIRWSGCSKKQLQNVISRFWWQLFVITQLMCRYKYYISFALRFGRRIRLWRLIRCRLWHKQNKKKKYDILAFYSLNQLTLFDDKQIETPRWSRVHTVRIELFSIRKCSLPFAAN